MSRVVSKPRATKKLKETPTTSVVKQHPQKTKRKKLKDGWEMSAQEALLVNFVVSEI